MKLTEKTLIPHYSDEFNKTNSVKAIRLLSVVSNKPGPGAMNYPRAELLIEPE